MSLHTIYLIILGVLASMASAGMIWWHHDAVLEGERKCETAQEKARQEQHDADLKATATMVQALSEDKAKLQAIIDARPRAPVVHCFRVPDSARSRVPTIPAPGGINSPEPANGGDDRSVSSGSGGGDVEPGVRAIAGAGEVLAIYRARLEEWAAATR